jgi:chromosome segregation ATPase
MTIDEIRDVLRAELAPIRAEIDVLRGELAPIRAEINGLRGELAPIRAEIDGLRGEVRQMRPLVDGIPLIHRAQVALQTDVRSLRDDMRVAAAMIQRLDGSHSLLLTELQAVHAQIIGLRDRIRKLEGADGP